MDRKTVSIEWVYTPSTFDMKSAVAKNLTLMFKSELSLYAGSVINNFLGAL